MLHRAADAELMQLHTRALFVNNADGDIVTVNEPAGARAPRFFLGTFSDGKLLRFRDDVNDEVRQQLSVAAEREVAAASFRAPIDSAPYQAILGTSAPIVNTWAGPAFCFSPADTEKVATSVLLQNVAPQLSGNIVQSWPENVAPPLSGNAGIVLMTADNAEMLLPFMKGWFHDTKLSAPMLALVENNQAVSLCSSVRRTARAHEAGIETAPAYRGRGYSRHVATAWARAVREMSCTPLYSTSWSNTASRAVAQKLGLHHFGSDLHIT